MIPKFIKNWVLGLLKKGAESFAKKHKLDKMSKLIKYVEQPNEIDLEMESLKKIIHKLQEENAMMLARICSQSDRIIALEKKKKFK